MIHRSKSFSKGGSNIDRVIEIQRYTIEPADLQELLRSKVIANGFTIKQAIVK